VLVDTVCDIFPNCWRFCCRIFSPFTLDKARVYIFPINQLEQLLACVHEAFPLEASGLLLQREHKRFTVLSVVGTSSEGNTPLSFRIRSAAIDKIAESLRDSDTKICGCFHSHVLGAARPSKRDTAATKEAGDLWFIYSVRFQALKLYGWNGRAFQKEHFRIVQNQ